jgi:hypothetical protein
MQRGMTTASMQLRHRSKPPALAPAARLSEPRLRPPNDSATAAQSRAPRGASSIRGEASVSAAATAPAEKSSCPSVRHEQRDPSRMARCSNATRSPSSMGVAAASHGGCKVGVSSGGSKTGGGSPRGCGEVQTIAGGLPGALSLARSRGGPVREGQGPEARLGVVPLCWRVDRASVVAQRSRR